MVIWIGALFGVMGCADGAYHVYETSCFRTAITVHCCLFWFDFHDTLFGYEGMSDGSI